MAPRRSTDGALEVDRWFVDGLEVDRWSTDGSLLILQMAPSRSTDGPEMVRGCPQMLDRWSLGMPHGWSTSVPLDAAPMLDRSAGGLYRGPG